MISALWYVISADYTPLMQGDFLLRSTAKMGAITGVLAVSAGDATPFERPCSSAVSDSALEPLLHPIMSRFTARLRLQR